MFPNSGAVRISFCFLLFVGVVTQGHAQSAKIDSLRKAVKQLTGNKRADALNRLAWELVFVDLNQSREVAMDALGLSRQLNYDRGKAEALITDGFCDLKVGNNEISIRKFKESIALMESGSDTLKGFALTYIGLNYQDLDKLDSSFYYLDQAYEILRDSTQPYYLSLVYMLKADNYEMRGQSDLQINYLNRSWAIRKKLADKRFMAYTSERLSGYFIEKGDYSEALSYLEEAQRALGTDTVDNEEINILNKQRAIILLKQSHHPAALRHFSNVTTFYEKHGFTSELTNLLLLVGDLFIEIDNYETALANYFKALTIAEENKYEFERTKILIQIGRVYYNLSQFDLAIQFTSRGVKLAADFGHRQQEASALNLLGLISLQQQQYDKAMSYYYEALKIRQNINDRTGIAGTTYNIGIVFMRQGDLRRSLDRQLQSLTIEESTGNRIGMAYSYQSLGELYTQMKDFRKAEEYLVKGEALTRELRSGKVLANVLKNRRNLLVAQSRFEEATRYSVLYEQLRDSLFKENLTMRIATLQNIFELDQKNKALELLHQQQELQREKLELQTSEIRQQSIIAWAAIVGFIGASTIAWFIYRYSTKVKLLNQEISQRNEMVQAQAEELTKSNITLSKLNRDIIERNEEIQAQSEELTEANQILSKLNGEMIEQKEKIQAQALELEKSNQMIKGVNEHLEDRIEVRTAELKQAYKELDTFFYRSSHDFRRPLTTFMGLAEVAKITIKDKVALELFDKVNETAHNLDGMLLKLQSISDLGMQELIYKEIFVEEFFRRELDIASAELTQRNIRTEVDVASDLSFYSYPALVKVMIENLIENSISFCGVKEPFIRLKALKENGEVVMIVEDNGQGIEEEYLGRIFDMYFRGNERSKGNGLGLYIVKKTADKLKARIFLQSKPGAGTRVSITFPTVLASAIY